MTPSAVPAPLRVGNASGFYGDRFSAVREMLSDGPLDVLTGDYLAELTMLILGRDRLRDPAAGYARTFPRQLAECLHLVAERGVRVVTNAGGLNPAGLAEELRRLVRREGLDLPVAYVSGDDLLAHPEAAGRESWGEGVLTANAYLGGHGITACLRSGAQLVVTGRVTDAALVSGAAAAHFGWDPGDHDRLAGAVVAGHLLECGAQVTGGNYSDFTAHDVRRPGFPLAELSADGGAVLTKHPGTGGAVTTGTVTAQLLYETGPARYLGPDVVARLDTVRIEQVGPDRVRVHGVRGEAPPPTLKAGLSRLGGHRGEVVFVLTGLDIPAKAALVRAQLTEALAERPPARADWELVRTDHPDAATEETASALLRLVVRDADPEAVGRRIGAAAVELGLAGYPGFHLTAPPGKPSPYGVFTATTVPQTAVRHTAHLADGTTLDIPPPPRTAAPPLTPPAVELPAPPPVGPVRRVPLGYVAGARSGDKGGDANLGVWAREPAAWPWLVHHLTTERLRTLLPETARLPVTRYVLPHLRAVNFVVEGLLGEGAAARHRFDPQAKALGEWLRARHVDVPAALLGNVPPTPPDTDPAPPPRTSPGPVPPAPAPGPPESPDAPEESRA
ncbi:acyclic terpene utilization AtuA family protein [Streptomyces sp. NEAU-H3]|uniref:acyclic terpene utilization AtuA family protein n=1 Tax=Streptomyces sp. NEAU-H3 TaxID=2720636 RepID=UPI00143B144B|nr:acyclic terpene utilization AtuA family protein [Streptomyces sp. NEAU-H3]NJA57103.1 DUF1446 domain-containing protein [Streptomyces sp. NEAU-H3]